MYYNAAAIRGYRLVWCFPIICCLVELLEDIIGLGFLSSVSVSQLCADTAAVRRDEIISQSVT